MDTDHSVQGGKNQMVNCPGLQLKGVKRQHCKLSACMQVVHVAKEPQAYLNCDGRLILQAEAKVVNCLKTVNWQKYS